VENCLQEEAELQGTVDKFQNKMKGLESQKDLATTLEADLEQERIEKEKLEAVIIQLEGETKCPNEKKC
jgi:hypothetical protein